MEKIYSYIFIVILVIKIAIADENFVCRRLKPYKDMGSLDKIEKSKFNRFIVDFCIPEENLLACPAWISDVKNVDLDPYNYPKRGPAAAEYQIQMLNGVCEKCVREIHFKSLQVIIPDIDSCTSNCFNNDVFLNCACRDVWYYIENSMVQITFDRHKEHLAEKCSSTDLKTCIFDCCIVYRSEFTTSQSSYSACVYFCHRRSKIPRPNSGGRFVHEGIYEFCPDIGRITPEKKDSGELSSDYYYNS